MKFPALIFLVAISMLFAGGCTNQPLPNPGPPPPPPSDDNPYPDDPYLEDDPYSGNQRIENPLPPTEQDLANCGGFEQECCNDFDIELNNPLNPGGVAYNTAPCDGGLECRAGICVEGPEYQAFDRNNIY